MIQYPRCAWNIVHGVPHRYVSPRSRAARILLKGSFANPQTLMNKPLIEQTQVSLPADVQPLFLQMRQHSRACRRIVARILLEGNSADNESGAGSQVRGFEGKVAAQA